MSKVEIEFKPSELPEGKRTKDQVGNNLFQDTIVAAYRNAHAFLRSQPPRVLSPAQLKQRRKNRAKRMGYK